VVRQFRRKNSADESKNLSSLSHAPLQRSPSGGRLPPIEDLAIYRMDKLEKLRGAAIRQLSRADCADQPGAVYHSFE
jgi:hypothetical protein